MNELSEVLCRPFRIIDISQPVTSQSACFPGDTPFSRQVTVSYEASKIINLTAMTMSPHVGTHVDAPVHVRGSMEGSDEAVGAMPLEAFVGMAEVVDIAPFNGAIEPKHLQGKIEKGSKRVLVRTSHQIRYQVFEEDYAYFSTDLVDWFQANEIVLAGIDTPSVDHTTSKTLDAHHRLLAHQIFWLENLDLTGTKAGQYFLVAAPLKFMELEASPVRALLIDWSSR